MKSKLQACIFASTLLVAAGCCHAQKQPVKITGKYKVVKVVDSKFNKGLEMLAKEREEYASQLTAYALSQIVEKKGEQQTLDLARKMIGVALHLSPRNRGAVIANIQLSKGIVPKNPKKAFNSSTFSSLLLARANVQKGIEGEPNKLLVHCFTQFAAELNPLNEDAIYNAAMLDQDRGAIDWTKFTGKK